MIIGGKRRKAGQKVAKLLQASKERSYERIKAKSPI
jgi:hypothetical protein